MMFKLDAKPNPNLETDYTVITPIVIEPPETFKKRGAALAEH
jgi:hypothetical protein